MTKKPPVFLSELLGRRTMLKKITSLLVVLVVLLVVPLLAGCQEKEIETRKEVEIDVQETVQQEMLVE